MDVCSVVKGKLKPGHVRWLKGRFTQLEVKEALFQMHPLKSPGPDGLPALFFQTFGHIVGSDVCRMVLRVLNIITKTIANHIKRFLPEIIDEEKNAFIQGILITYNALVAMECFHWLKNKRKGKHGVMALKLDMDKAYDRLDWPFIIDVLTSMGFPT